MSSTLSELSASTAALARAAAGKIFHVPSVAGGRSALSFDGRRLLVPAREAERDEEVTILGPGGLATKSKVAGFDPRLGLAVLELAEAIPASAWDAAPAMPELGSLALSVAYPSEDGVEARLDLVRIAHGAPDGEEAYIQVDGSSFPGFSGGALVDLEGRLLGMIASDRSGNRGWILPALRAKALVEAVVAKGFPSRARLGISSIPVELPEALAAGAGGRREGLLIAALEAGGAAEKAGLLPGDILLSVGGKEVREPAELREAIGSLVVGRSITLSLLRGGKPLEVEVTPGEGPQEDEEGRRWHRHHGGHGRFHGHHHGGDCGCGGSGCGCSTDR